MRAGTHAALMVLLVGASTYATHARAENPIAIRNDSSYSAVPTLVQWQTILKSARQLPEQQRAEIINQYVNRLQSIPDAQLWGVDDYWSTPTEMFYAGGGDCEDFAIAKYQALIDTGIPVQRLWLAYSKLLQAGTGRIESHMVLVFEDRAARLWVLDNVQSQLLPLNSRHDLIVSTGLNGFGMWKFLRGSSPKLIAGYDALPQQARRVIENQSLLTVLRQ
ncbi:MAG: transglutaminase-like cysteine peptidase [Gammaproteobacteria bacterium]